MWINDEEEYLRPKIIKPKKTRNLRLIDRLIIHCSDSDNPEHDNIETIRQWHIEKGFKDIGYHLVLTKDGAIHSGRPIDHVGAHCITQNISSIGLCLTGSKNFSEKQFEALAKIVQILMDRFRIPRDRVFPHNYFNKGKTCPNFNINIIWQYLDKQK